MILNQKIIFIQATKSAFATTKSEIIMKSYEKIRAFREKRDLTQEEMAVKLNMSTTGYAKIERGETRLNIPRLEQIAEIFDVDIFELICHEERMIYQTNNEVAGNNSEITYYAQTNDNQAELEKLQLIIAHKDEIIAEKNQKIAMLEEMVALLKKAAK